MDGNAKDTFAVDNNDIHYDDKRLNKRILPLVKRSNILVAR